MKKVVLLLITITYSIFLIAQQTQESPRLQLLLETGVEYGDDNFKRVVFPNGEVKFVSAGFGVNVNVGGQLRLKALPDFLFRGTIGAKYDRPSTRDSYVELRRFPVTGMAYWMIVDDVRFGIGATSHLAVRFKGNAFLPNEKLSSSTGPRLELGYKWLAVTYSVLTYTDAFDEQFRADSFGFVFSMLIPKKKKTKKAKEQG